MVGVLSELAKQGFEEYMAEQIQQIAKTGEPSDPEFREKLNVYLGLIERGMSPKAAKAVMNWYMER